MAKATIKDVAEKAGVSVKTVSRVLNDEPRVKPSTKEKVEKAVAELKFKRNPLACGLRSNQSFVVTLIYSNPNPGYIYELQNGILSQCSKLGYHLQLQPCDYKDPNLLEIIEDLIEHTPQDGLLLTHPVCDNQAVRELLVKKGMPFARISTFREDKNSPGVYCNDKLAAIEMTNHLISLGHTKIAFIKGHPDFGATEKRYLGFLEAMKSWDIEVNPTFVKEGAFTFASGEEAARKLLIQKDKPTAIFSSNDYMAAGVLKVAAQLGINVPTDLSVVGYDDTPVSQQIWPSITTLRQPIFELAQTAVNQLVKKIKKQDISEQDIEFKCELITRASAGPIKINK
ncbi:LacI family DNA-binding transcriptional regulator [Catenovulum sp. 2E275]|uniref:LacI family DNA-binding transcriptional regulator n=1 Tax=Catenovulum sp. 2E275 TaxID=2980497 RepID=UPI0021CFFD58|nr:LacI family DNA-binding transcriptional regulator [Catenovulum sp. 2E275]MCU4675238.1 LacI family DNA-binding transcriptional regulator [Catenovulum sp. 2E275]